MDRITDTHIRAGLRTVLARHRVDLTKTQFFCTRGVVRMTGELSPVGAEARRMTLSLCAVEAFEHDVTRVKGVERVHFDFANWRRLDNGEWKPLQNGRYRTVPRDEAGEADV